MNKYLLSVLVSFASINASVAKTQCISINIPAFNLSSDSSCSVSSSKQIKSNLADQVFLYNLGFPAEETCFSIFDPTTGLKDIQGTIQNPATGEEIDITFSGVAGLTFNAYPGPTDPVSFTAASLLTIKIDGKVLGRLITRDAGTIFNIPDPSMTATRARLSIEKGTRRLKGVSGYIDKVGKEFTPFDPAHAAGTLCGKDLAKSLFGKIEHD